VVDGRFEAATSIQLGAFSSKHFWKFASVCARDVAGSAHGTAGSTRIDGGADHRTPVSASARHTNAA
jgi:hypothetical protein